MEYFIKKLLREALSPNSGCSEIKLTQDMIDYVSQFDSDEQLLRKGGLPIEILDKAAHGFCESDITSLTTNKLNIMWDDDIDNVKFEIANARKKGMSPEEYAKRIDLSEPIDVDYMEDLERGLKRGFYIQDGHHRYMAAKILGKPVNVTLKIKINPFKVIGGGMDYDQFHRCLFKQIKNA